MIRFFAAFLLTVSPVFSEKAPPLTVISYNIRNDNQGDKGPRNWKGRKALLATYLLNHKASIIGLQEVKHNQLLDMTKGLPNYAYIGVGRDDGKMAGEFSPIFYDRKIWRLDAEEHGTY